MTIGAPAPAQQPARPAAPVPRMEPWQDAARLIPWEPHTGDRFGAALAFDGENLIVGAYTDLTDAGPGSGSVTFVRAAADGAWEEVTHLIASDALPQDWLGGSVAIDGPVAVAGAIGDDRPGGLQSGSAYVYLQDALGQWSEAAKLTATDAASQDQFGFSVAVKGDFVFVGAPYVGFSDGAVYVFLRTGPAQWEQTQMLVGTPWEAKTFGHSLAVRGQTLVVGARSTNEVFLFEQDAGGAWIEVQRLAEPATFFGHSVAIDGDTLVVAAMTDEVDGYTGAGAAYVYRRDGGGGWSLTGRIVASEPAPRSWFGRSLAIHDDVIVVGSVRASYFGLQEAGAAYVFRATVDGQWRQTARLLVSDGRPFDWFGQGAAAGDGVLFIGAQTATDPTSQYGCGVTYVWELDRRGPAN